MCVGFISSDSQASVNEELELPMHFLLTVEFGFFVCKRRKIFSMLTEPAVEGVVVVVTGFLLTPTQYDQHF